MRKLIALYLCISNVKPANMPTNSTTKQNRLRERAVRREFVAASSSDSEALGPSVAAMFRG